MSMEFSRQEYCSGLLFPSSGELLNPGIKPGSPALQADFFFFLNHLCQLGSPVNSTQSGGCFKVCKTPQIYYYVHLLKGNKDCSKAELLLLLTLPRFSLHPPPVSSQQLFESAHLSSGKTLRLNEVYFLLSRNVGHGKASVPRSPQGPAWYKGRKWRQWW